MRLTTTGLKGHNVDLELPGKLVLVSGPNGSGKSTIADGIRIAALGAIPALGKREQDTAQLMHGRELSVHLSVGDKTISRTLSRTGRGAGLSWSVECSWVASKKSEDHAAAALGLFGADERSVEEVLDLRALLKLSGPARAARIESLIRSDADPKELARMLARYTLQRLAGVEDGRMPEDHRDLRPMVDGYDKDDVAHRGQYRALLDVFPDVQAKVAELGLGGAAGAINELKKAKNLAIRNKRQARDELAPRLAGIADPNAEDLAALEDRRAQLERQIGAGKERRRQAAARKEEIEDADRALKRARQALEDAVAARRDFLADGASSTKVPDRERDAIAQFADRERADSIAEELATMTPGEPPPEPPQIALLRQNKDWFETALAECAEPKAVPDASALQDEVTRLEKRLAAAKEAPWMQVLKRTALIRDWARRKYADEVIRWADEILQIAAENTDNVEGLAMELAGAREGLAAKLEAIGEAKRTADEVRAERDRLTTDLAAAVEAMSTAVGAYEETLRQARLVYVGRKAALLEERERLRPAIEALAKQDRETADALTRAQARMDAADRVRAALGEPEVPEAAADTGDELDRVQAQLATLHDHQARHRELQALVDDITAREAEAVVLTALEASCTRLRADQVRAEGGPLKQRIDAFLRAAGRAETAYIDADKQRCDFGLVRDGVRITVGALSGGEYCLYATALVAAILSLRDAEVRILLVEAAESDQATLQQLLRGIAGVAGNLDACLVLTPHQPSSVPDSWVMISPNGEQADRSSERAA